MPTPKRRSAEDARRLVDAGDALLVCAYEDDEKCEKFALDPAINSSELSRRLDSLDRSQHLLLYCA